MSEERAASPDMPQISEGSDVPEARAPEPAQSPAVSDAPAPSSPQLAAALELISQLPQLSLERHADVYERVHAELSGALAEINDA